MQLLFSWLFLLLLLFVVVLLLFWLNQFTSILLYCIEREKKIIIRERHLSESIQVPTNECSYSAGTSKPQWTLFVSFINLFSLLTNLQFLHQISVITRKQPTHLLIRAAKSRLFHEIIPLRKWIPLPLYYFYFSFFCILDSELKKEKSRCVFYGSNGCCRACGGWRGGRVIESRILTDYDGGRTADEKLKLGGEERVDYCSIWRNSD